MHRHVKHIQLKYFCPKSTDVHSIIQIHYIFFPYKVRGYIQVFQKRFSFYILKKTHTHNQSFLWPLFQNWPELEIDSRTWKLKIRRMAAKQLFLMYFYEVYSHQLTSVSFSVATATYTGDSKNWKPFLGKLGKLQNRRKRSCRQQPVCFSSSHLARERNCLTQNVTLCFILHFASFVNL